MTGLNCMWDCFETSQ